MTQKRKSRHEFILKGKDGETVARLSVYRDTAKEWRWRLTAANNRVIADSGEGYKNFSDCTDGALLSGDLLVLILDENDANLECY